jgi:hypothetical protein
MKTLTTSCLLAILAAYSLDAQTVARIGSSSLRTRAAAQKAGPNRQLFVPPLVNFVFPYLLAGSNRTTTLYLTNLENRKIKVYCDFIGLDGEELPLAFDFSANEKDTTAYTESIMPPYSTGSFRTVSTATALTTGWTFCAAEDDTDRFSGYAVVRSTAADGSSREFITPLQPDEEPVFSVPFTEGASSQTSLVVINVNSKEGSSLALWYYDGDGKTVGNGSITLKPGYHRTILLNDVFKTVPNGTVRVVSVEGTKYITGMALRTNAAGSAVFAPLAPKEAPPAPPAQ